MAKGEDGRQWERETRSVAGRGMTSNLRHRRGVSMTGKGNGRQGVWQEKRLVSNL
jgi:hypothetical protein